MTIHASFDFSKCPIAWGKQGAMPKHVPWWGHFCISNWHHNFIKTHNMIPYTIWL